MDTFKLALREGKARHIAERQPRFDVTLNGRTVGELYFNMRGYVGYLPTVSGALMDIGECSIAAFRKEVATINKEAAVILKRCSEDKRVCLAAYPTANEDFLVIAIGSRSPVTGPGGIVTCYVDRSEWERGCVMLGTDRPAAAWFNFLDVETFILPDLDDHKPDKTDVILAVVQTADFRKIAFLCGPGASAAPRSSDVAHCAAARSVVFSTPSQYRMLKAIHGEVIPVAALPLAGPMNLPAEFRPAISDAVPKEIQEIYNMLTATSKSPRYIVADPDAQSGSGWGHIFDEDDKTAERVVRFVYDLESEKMLAADIMMSTGWVKATTDEMASVEDSLKDANPEAVIDPEDYGMFRAGELPEWALMDADATPSP